MAIYKNSKIEIDLNELVECRLGVLNQNLTEYEVEQIAVCITVHSHLGYSLSHG